MTTPQLERLQEKWYRKVKNRGKVWADSVRGKDDAYVQGLSAKTGVAPETIRRSKMGVGYRDFAANPDEYVPDYEAGIEAARKQNKWAEKFYKALTTPAE